MKDDLPVPVLFEKLSVWDVSAVIRVYESCSPQLKEMMMGAWPLTSRLGRLHLILSATPFRFLLLFRIRSCIARQAGEIAGMAYIINKWYKKEKVLGIFVTERFQHKGIGRQLLDRILRDEDDVQLNVCDNNIAAIRMYEKAGFEHDGTVRHMSYHRRK